MSGPTLQQQAAIAARGNVLVMAGAGTGKTHTLVQRCLALLLDAEHSTSLDRLLMVTFTEAAAAEMRQRIRETLEKTLLKEREAETTDPALQQRLEEQLALLDTASIGTLHGFCLRLIREHFHELELDPQLNVLDAGAAALLREETLDRILRQHYSAAAETPTALQQFIRDYGRGQDGSVRALIHKLHAYAQTLPRPDVWLAEQDATFSANEPQQWLAWWSEAVRGLAKYRPLVERLQEENTSVAFVATWLSALERTSADELNLWLSQLITIKSKWPRAKKGEGDRNKALKKALEPLFDAAAFLADYAPTAEQNPLQQDWDWVRHGLRAVIDVTREFTGAYRDAKREQASVDFADLEQLALSLLWNDERTTPSATAIACRERFDFVFVDEYQDINAAQDLILQALSRTGAKANRFLVGDVKQSIYRFRLANPHIFQNYAARWGQADDGAQVIPLSDNFRSREAILKFINAAFATLMRTEIGGVAYNEAAVLHFGNAAGRAPLAATEPRVELQLLLTGTEPEQDETEEVSGAVNVEELTTAEREARWVATRLAALRREGHQVWDEKAGAFRPADWRDMVVLLRSPSTKAELYAKEFARQGVPFAAPRGGFYRTLEISDLLSLLQILDNPLQDIPLLAVLRSPVVGLSLTDLALIRQAQAKVPFWIALRRFTEASKANPALSARLARFLKQYQHWRQRLRHVPLSECLETILQETHYEAILRTADRADQRLANVRQLLAAVRQFDQFNREGLFRFLRFVTAQQENDQEPESATTEAGNAVRLLSIHQSKGLEFPVVVLADLNKPFNQDDLRSPVLLDEYYGLCARVRPPERVGMYPSLAFWLASQRQRNEMLGEELRLLYVAMTRARDTLILVGTTTQSTTEKRWAEAQENLGAPAQLAKCRSYLDWLGPWFAELTGDLAWATKPTGITSLLRWTVTDATDASLARPMMDVVFDNTTNSTETDPARLIALRERLSWRYTHEAAGHLSAKTSVSIWRRLLADETDDEASPWRSSQTRRTTAKRTARSGKLTAAEIGTAHHLFLELAELDQLHTKGGLIGEAQRLERDGLLSSSEADALDIDALAGFWHGDLGRRILAAAPQVQRELPFTARFGRDDLPMGQSLPENLAGLDAEEFVVVQGVIDLAVIRPDEIWLVDFKTDQFDQRDLPEKVREYAPQIGLYASALERIFRRPVTERWLHFLALGQSVLLGEAPNSKIQIPNEE